MINTMNDSFSDFAKSVLPVKKFRKNSKNKNFHASKKIWMDEHASLNNQQICFKKFCYSRRANLRETDTERTYQYTEEQLIRFEPFQVFVTLQGRTFNHIMAPGYLYDSIVMSIKDKFQLSECHYYLRNEGIILSQFHYFKNNGKPYFIEVCIKGFGGSRKLVINRKCQECGRFGNCHTFQKCPQAAALDREESSKGKSELSNSNLSSEESNNSTERSVSSGTRKYFKQLLFYEATEELRENNVEPLESLKYYHPQLYKELAEELLQEEVHVTQKECNYDTDRLKKKINNDKKRQKDKNTKFEETAKAIFVGSPGSVKDLAEKLSINKEQPESKLQVVSSLAPLQKTVTDTRGNHVDGEVELDPFELLEFEYEVPEDFLFFKLEAKREILLGKLPRFACQFLNLTSSMPSSAINLRNALLLLFKEDTTKRYVMNLTNNQLNLFYKMTIAYYSTVQYDQMIRPTSKILNWISSLRKKNVDDLKDDSPYGYNIKNLVSTAKLAIEHQFTVWGKKLFHTIKESEHTKRVIEFVKRNESKVFIDDDSDDSDDDNHYDDLPVLTMEDEIFESEQLEDVVAHVGSMESLIESFPDIDGDFSFDTEKLEFAVDYLEKRQAELETTSTLETVTFSISESPPMSPDTLNTTKMFGRFEEPSETKSEPVSNKATRKMNKKKELKKANALNKKNQKLSNIVSNNVLFVDAKGEEPKDDGLMTIFPSIPKASVIIEEVVKQILPFGIGATIIGKIDDFVHGSKTRLKWHRNSMKYPFYDRIKMHHKYNENVTNNLVNHYELYSNSSELMPKCIVSELENLNDGKFLSSVPLPIINPELVDVYPYPHVNSPQGALERKQELIKFYPLLFAINNFVSYANTNENFVAAVLCRLLYPKTNGPVEGEWKKLIDEIQIFPFDFVPDFEKWFKTLTPNQKALVQKHLEAAENGDKIDTSTGVFLKMKELLKKSSKGYGRLIFNVSTKYLYLLGDFLSQFSTAMVASLFPPVPTNTISKIACFHYASKFSDVAMNQFVNLAMLSPCGKFVLVLGDDTMIIDRDIGRYTEVDFSAYDSTQVRGGGLDLFPALLEKMGCVEQADEYKNMYNEKIKWKHNQSGEKLEMPDSWETSPSRMSGEPGTSVANSYTTIIATKAVLEGTSSYARLGLVAKERHSNELDTTFLKGIFLYSVKADKWYWTRLPGFVLKLKSFTEPMSVYKGKYSVQKAQQQLLWSQWLGFGNTQTNWFYTKLGNIIKNLCPLASNTDTIYVKEEYKVFTEDKFYIEDIEFDSMMWNRYGISREESEDYLSFISENATALPIIYQHSLTDKLFEVDA
jgi:hypothetical protein